jgi:hypothetical protein
MHIFFETFSAGTDRENLGICIFNQRNLIVQMPVFIDVTITVAGELGISTPQIPKPAIGYAAKLISRHFPPSQIINLSFAVLSVAVFQRVSSPKFCTQSLFLAKPIVGFQ